MKIVKISLSFLLVLTILSSCGDEPSKPTDNTSLLWPLAEGYFWRYYCYQQYKGEKYKLYGFTDDKVKKQVKIGNDYWYVMGSMFDSDMDIMMMNDASGLWIDTYTGSASNTTAKHLMFKYPTFKGDIHIVDGDTVETTTLSAAVNTYAGVFNCIGYSIKGHNSLIYYYTPGVGPVKAMQVIGYAEENGQYIAVWYVKELYDYWVK